MKTKFVAFYPLVYLIVGMAFLFIGQYEFDRRVTRDNAELRHDLVEAEMPRSQIAVLLSAQTKLEESASSYIWLACFLMLVLSTSMAIPLYSRKRAEI